MSFTIGLELVMTRQFHERKDKYDDDSNVSRFSFMRDITVINILIMAVLRKTLLPS